jgi:hypothetical protein
MRKFLLFFSLFYFSIRLTAQPISIATHLIYSNQDELIYFLNEPELKLFYSNGKSGFRELKIIDKEWEDALSGYRYFVEKSSPFRIFYIMGGMLDYSVIICDYEDTTRNFYETCSEDLYSTTEDLKLDYFSGSFYDPATKGLYIFTRDHQKNPVIYFLDSATGKQEKLEVKYFAKGETNEILARYHTQDIFFYPEFYENKSPFILLSYHKKTKKELEIYSSRAFEYPHLNQFPFFHKSYIDWNTHEILSLQVNKGDTQIFYSNGKNAYRNLVIVSSKHTLQKGKENPAVGMTFRVSFYPDSSKIYTLQTILPGENNNLLIECRNPDKSKQLFEYISDADTAVRFAGILTKTWTGSFRKELGDDRKIIISGSEQPSIIYKTSSQDIILQLNQGSWETTDWTVTFPGEPDRRYKLRLGYFNHAPALFLKAPDQEEEIFIR